MDPSPDPLLARLTDPDPERRASAIREVRYRHLKDPRILAAMLASCRDQETVAGQSSSVDPFAAFFGGAAPGAVHIADIAAERLIATGLPTDTATVDAIAAALETQSPETGERLSGLVARALGETRWDDMDHAVRTLFVALEPYDVPLFHTITLLPQASRSVLIARAIHPAKARLLQELMNHEPSRAPLLSAIEAAETLTDSDITTLASLLAAWGEPKLASLCAKWASRLPYVWAWAAIDDPDAAQHFARWLAQGGEGPQDLFPRMAEVIRQRGISAGFPLAAWLRAAGDDFGLLDTPSVELSEILDDEIAGILGAWVLDLAAGCSPERGWRAVRILATAGRHGSVAQAITDAIGRRPSDLALPWSSDLLMALARAEPPIAGLSAALLDKIREEPAAAGEAVSALQALVARGEPRDVLRSVAEIVLSAAEAAPIEEIRLNKATVRRQRAGIAPESVRPLVDALGDDALAARLDALAPAVEAG